MAYTEVVRGRLVTLRKEVLIKQFADASKLLFLARWMSWPNPPQAGEELIALQTAIYDLKHRADQLDRRLEREFLDEFSLAREMKLITDEKDRCSDWLEQMREKV